MSKNKTYQILLEKDCNTTQPSVNDFDAVMYCATRHKNIKSLRYKDYKYMVGSDAAILVDQKIYFELCDIKHHDKNGKITHLKIRLYSEHNTIKEIKEYIKHCREVYDAQKNNKLGDCKYFFDQTSSADMRFKNALIFDKKKFSTCRTFENVFFEQKKKVMNRVQHFMTKKEWYSKRGIPYTLGFMFHGPPGTGKTSTIKAIANVSNRHIINVHMGEIKTNTQLKNLFYNPTMQVVNSDTMNVETFVVPISQRLYVIEDIDCMTDLIMDRALRDDNTVASFGGFSKKEEMAKKHARIEEELKKAAAPLINAENPDMDDFFAHQLMEEKFEMMKEKDEELEDKITLDSLLNILDGTLEIPNRMMCITTNRPDYMDPAFKRHGRIDMTVEFKLCNQPIVKQMFESFYEDEDFKDELFKNVKAYKISPAQVNHILFNNFGEPQVAIKELEVLSNKRKPRAKKSDSVKDKV